QMLFNLNQPASMKTGAIQMTRERARGSSPVVTSVSWKAGRRTLRRSSRIASISALLPPEAAAQLLNPVQRRVRRT
ncbi:MAG: hypothetical protein ABTQ25_20310, partial [Nitrosomonas ureae]